MDSWRVKMPTLGIGGKSLVIFKLNFCLYHKSKHKTIARCQMLLLPIAKYQGWEQLVTHSRAIRGSQYCKLGMLSEGRNGYFPRFNCAFPIVHFGLNCALTIARLLLCILEPHIVFDLIHSLSAWLGYMAGIGMYQTLLCIVHQQVVIMVMGQTIM